MDMDPAHLRTYVPRVVFGQLASDPPAPWRAFDGSVIFADISGFTALSEKLAKRGREGAEQIGVHGSISPETIEGAEIVYGNLLDDGEKVRHHPEKLAQVLILCALQPRDRVIA